MIAKISEAKGISRFEVEAVDLIKIFGEGHQVVPTVVIGLPVCYAHTHYGFAANSDYKNGVKRRIAASCY